MGVIRHVSCGEYSESGTSSLERLQPLAKGSKLLHCFAARCTAEISQRPERLGRRINRPPQEPFSHEEHQLTIDEEIRGLARTYAATLKKQIDKRVDEMDADDDSHFLIYQVLGVSDQEGHLIDVYQNKGRFLYKYAGSFLENAAKACFRHKFPASGSLRVPNTRGQRPKTFEIDCQVDKDALEIKWRDATTDGDHITKEHTRIQAIGDAGFRPIRVMFYYPNRTQAIRIQQTLETLYDGVGGEYHFGDAAWKYVNTRTGVDLHGILKRIAAENTGKPA